MADVLKLVFVFQPGHFTRNVCEGKLSWGKSTCPAKHLFLFNKQAAINIAKLEDHTLD
jgi:hypothetical protein